MLKTIADLIEAFSAGASSSAIWKKPWKGYGTKPGVSNPVGMMHLCSASWRDAGKCTAPFRALVANATLYSRASSELRHRR